MDDVEQWRPVKGWEDLYEVSDHCRVRSLDRWVERSHTGPFLLRSRILKTQIHTQGYRVITLSRGSNKKTVKLHRLIAEAFIENPDNLPLVLHGANGIKDNRPPNLRWGTHSDNNRDTVRDGNHVQAKKKHCPRGHDYSTRKTDGARVCKTCQRESVKRWRDRRGEADD